MSKVFQLDDLLKCTGGQLVQAGPSEFDFVSTDTRKDNQRALFFALKGESFDAHDYVDQAIRSGAQCLVVHQPIKVNSELVTIVQVNDTLIALQKFASYWRKKLNTRLAAVTGSNGKTTTKEFAATLLSTKYRTHYSKGSFNNHFGVPMSLLELRAEHEMAVQEMGMNHKGEITKLVEIADPNVVCVTTVGRAHLEGLGSLKEIAEAKEEIYLASRPEATRVFNLDNPFTKSMVTRAPKASPIVSFSSFDSQADIHLKERLATLEMTEVMGTIGGEPGQAKVPVFGRQNINNLMAAAGIALASGVEPDRIWKSLPNCRMAWGRNQILSLSSGAKVIFDAYNANPDSVTALIDNVSRLSVNGRKFAIIGEMLEMGDHSEQVHEEIGKKLSEGDFELIWFVGSKGESFARGFGAAVERKKLIITTTYDEKVASELGSMLQTDDIILVKGSRGMKLEKIVQQWSPQDF